MVARRDAQLEKSRSRSFEQQFLATELRLRNEGAVIQAIASVNRVRRESGKEPLYVSPGFSNTLSDMFGDPIANLIEVKQQRFGNQAIVGEIELLKAIEAQQRKEFGAMSLSVASTLDQLGEKYHNSKNFDLATEALRRSFFIHTEVDKDSVDRCWTGARLIQALILNDQKDEAESYLQMVKRKVDSLNDPRLSAFVDDLADQLDY